MLCINPSLTATLTGRLPPRFKFQHYIHGTRPLHSCRPYDRLCARNIDVPRRSGKQKCCAQPQ
jgi:hypothetical protein